MRLICLGIYFKQKWKLVQSKSTLVSVLRGHLIKGCVSNLTMYMCVLETTGFLSPPQIPSMPQWRRTSRIKTWDLYFDSPVGFHASPLPALSPTALLQPSLPQNIKQCFSNCGLRITGNILRGNVLRNIHGALWVLSIFLILCLVSMENLRKKINRLTDVLEFL